jgi:hypothetical protein
MSRSFSKEVQMNNTFMEKWSIYFAIREAHIKTEVLPYRNQNEYYQKQKNNADGDNVELKAQF